jgi:hypothetical protein
MTDTKRLVAVVGILVVLAPLLSACGDEAGSCGKVQPCGGNVVGNYDVTAACTTDPTGGMDFGINCPEAVVGTPAISITGSASFNADFTYMLTRTVSATAPVTFPPSCLAALTGGITLTCEQINQAVPLLIASMPDVIQAATCSGSGATCTCTVTLVPQTTSESGEYNTSGTTLTTIVSSTGTVYGGQYCVQGNELHYIQVEPTMPMTIIADTVLTKR